MGNPRWTQRLYRCTSRAPISTPSVSLPNDVDLFPTDFRNQNPRFLNPSPGDVFHARRYDVLPHKCWFCVDRPSSGELVLFIRSPRGSQGSSEMPPTMALNGSLGCRQILSVSSMYHLAAENPVAKNFRVGFIKKVLCPPAARPCSPRLLPPSPASAQ